MAQKQSALIPALMLLISLILANKAARAQGTVELMCRNKAKELAFQTYQNCVTEEKAVRLKDLKERYKSRMSEVKSEFQKELDDLNGKKPSTTAAPKTGAKAKKPGRPGRAEKPVAGLATALPAKQNDNGPAQAIQNATEDELTVVTMVPASESAEPEIVDVSTEP